MSHIASKHVCLFIGPASEYENYVLVGAYLGRLNRLSAYLNTSTVAYMVTGICRVLVTIQKDDVGLHLILA